MEFSQLRIYIILPVYNRRTVTINFVQCLISQTYKNWHLIIVDDGSTDGTAKSIKELLNSKQLTIIYGSGNLFWGGSLHKGYKWMKNCNFNPNDFVLLINDDNIFDEFFFENAVSSLNTLPEKAILKAVTCDFANQQILNRGINANWQHFFFKNTDEIKLTNCIDTNGLFIRIFDFINSNGFYPTLLPHYLSDYEYSIRLYNQGFTFVFDEKVKLLWNMKTTTNEIIPEFSSRCAFLKKYFSKRSSMNPLAWFWFVVLSCPWKYKFQNIAIVFKRMFLSVYYKKGIY